MPTLPTLRELARLEPSDARWKLDFYEGELHLLLAEEDWGCKGAAHHHALIRRRLNRLDRIRSHLGL